MAAPKVKVIGSLCLPWILVESEKTIKSNKFTAMICVKAPPLVRRSNAAPIHLVVVLDVWGRMSQQWAAGQRLELLKTMEFISGEFHGRDTAKDQVEVVDACAFDDDETMSMSIDDWITGAKGNQERTELKRVLKGAVQILDESKQSSGDVKRVGFILLLSDGRSKLMFDKSVNDFLRRYPVYTFGLGSNHDPEMLYSIAQRSRGIYSSIADLNNNKLLETVAMRLGGLKSVVAINTRVRINVSLDDTHPDRTNNINKKDIRIKIQPGDHDISGSKEGFLVGDGVLYAGEVKDLIVDINFSTIAINSRTRSATLTATVEYEDSSHKQVAPPPRCNLPLLVTGTSNERAMKAYKELEELLPNSMVLQRMIMPEVLEMLVSFATTIKKKKKTTTAAAAADQLLSTWDKLKKDGKNLRVTQKISDLIDLLPGIDYDMKEMAKCLQREGVSSGLSSIYSWVSSHQMQRATNTGLPLPPPAPATPFLTQEMETMVRNARNKQQLVAQKEPPPPSPPNHKDAVKMGKQEDMVPAQPGTSTTSLDDKSKRAIQLFERIEELLAWYKERPSKPKTKPKPKPKPKLTAGPSSSSKGDTDDLIFIQFQREIYEAAEQAINDWQATISGSGK